MADRMAFSMANELPKLPPARLRALKKDPQKSAAAIDLCYVNDRMPGITRRRSGKGFSYRLKGNPVSEKSTLARIRSLAIPPAWTDVWICPMGNGHLQATGKDVRGRKQYRYHPKWSLIRSSTKFHHMIAFGERLPSVRDRIQKDLALPGLPKEKVLALVVNILDGTPIRVGNAEYERTNASYGLSTLKDRHVRPAGTGVKLRFKGKTGIMHEVRIKSKRLGRLVMRCRDLPGQELFQFLDEDGRPIPIDSGMVNGYIREIAGEEFSSKDFRTWKGTVHCLAHLIAAECPSTVTARREMINKALDEAAAVLGNTRAICRKYYVHPKVIDTYECDRLHRFLARSDSKSEMIQRGLTFEEKLVLKVLKSAPVKAS